MRALLAAPAWGNILSPARNARSTPPGRFPSTSPATRDQSFGVPASRFRARTARSSRVQGGHTGRDLPRAPSDLSLPASGTAGTLAAGLAVCAAMRAHSWVAGPAAGTEGGESRRPQPSADRHGPARGVDDEPRRCLSRWRSAPTERPIAPCYQIVNGQCIAPDRPARSCRRRSPRLAYCS